MGPCVRGRAQQQLEKHLCFNALRGRQLWRNQGNFGQGKATALMRLRFVAERLLTRIDDARRFENHPRDRRVIIAHRVPAIRLTQECWFLLRELERATVRFFLAMSAASHIAARHRSSLRAARLLKRERRATVRPPDV
jgi:hypothetical protein